jgi:hypothetical protein
VSTITKALLSAGMRLALAFTASVAGAASVQAGDWFFRPFDLPAATYTADFGLRFWYGRSNTAKNLFDPSGAFLLSRLTYGDLSIFAGEAYGRFDVDRRWFVKGYIGGGGLRQGNLKDEDFPPGIIPYSATRSVQDTGSPIYGSVDLGFNALVGPDFRVGVFAGFHYLNEQVSAFGCTQIAFNPDVCAAPFVIPDPLRVITQTNIWYSARIGFDATVEFDRFHLTVDAAWLPYVTLFGSDTHWLRIGGFVGDFTGPISENGTGWGYQLEAFLSYRVTDWFNVGIGGRYWSMQTHGLTHFENHVVGVTAFPQPVDWKVQNYGVFLQASLKLGPYSVVDVH